jgi:hypothetical protein
VLVLYEVFEGLVDYTGTSHERIVSRRGGYRESCKYPFGMSFVAARVRTSATQDFDFGYPHLTKLIQDSSYVRPLIPSSRLHMRSHNLHSLGY